MQRKGLFVFILALALTLPAAAQAFNLTGKWTCDDGGTYYISHSGNEIWWYGEQNPINPVWSNIAHGLIGGDNILTLDWSDVPKGQIMQKGKLTLKAESNNKITALQKTGGFGGSVWTRKE